jgi:hypothetical protein
MIDQKQLENVECFKYFGSILTKMEDVLVKLNPGLPLQKLHSRRRRIFYQHIELKFEEKN